MTEESRTDAPAPDSAPADQPQTGAKLIPWPTGRRVRRRQRRPWIVRALPEPAQDDDGGWVA
jgi:hypothetical protein